MSSLKRKAADPATSSTLKKSASIANFFKPVASSAVSNFDKAKWVAGLSAEQKELLAMEIETLHESWLSVLKEELVSPSFLNLKRFLAAETAEIYPPREDVYSWSRHTPLDTIKVVVLGQDPYHGVNQAMGLSFSVRPPTPAPPSLVNIYKAIQVDYPDFRPPPNRSGLLTPWADRGVLMLNACLTVRKGNANSHANKGWERFTSKVLEVIAKRRTSGVVFMAWGKYAENMIAKLDTRKHLVLKSVHPSPLSAHRGFFQCGHFKKANEWLETRYDERGPIDWSLHGDPVGVPESRMTKKAVAEKAVAEKAPPVKAKVVVKPPSFTEDDDPFDADEEEAMLQATMEAEQLFSSQGAPTAMDAEADHDSVAKEKVGDAAEEKVGDAAEEKVGDAAEEKVGDATEGKVDAAEEKAGDAAEEIVDGTKEKPTDGKGASDVEE